ncbi:5'-AMP-activated protein kinase subunit gamma-1 [Entophlyctis sp. JEL0112]|nr:5'-AMP-activated protein kinase subunit gamma-1 [Entophlyctis sp. JEL0112]
MNNHSGGPGDILATGSVADRLRSTTCYSMLPGISPSAYLADRHFLEPSPLNPSSLAASSKLVVFETRMKVRHALTALVQHGIGRPSLLPFRIQSATLDYDLIGVFVQRLKIVAKYSDVPIAKKTLRELKLGTYKNLKTATPSTPLITVLNMFVKDKISAVPIQDEKGLFIDIYEKFDVLLLTKEGSSTDLSIPLSQALSGRSTV